MRQALIDAISTRQVIEFDYDGHHRIVHPGAVGEHVTTGNPLLRGYQVGGTSKSREVPLWDLFSLSKILNLRTNGESFEGFPPYYKPNDSMLDPIWAQLA